MYFSEHNDNISFSNEWGGVLKVEGKGLVCAEDLNAGPGYFKPEDYTELEFTKGITKVTKGFIEAFTSMKCLVIGFSVKSIERTPELDNYLITNNVLIRGEYNSLAEKLAGELGLRFLHCDIFLGWTSFETQGYRESTKRTLCFRLDGPPYIYRQIFTPGISAGSSGGADLREDLPEDFYVGCDLDGFTYNLPQKCEEAIMKNKQLGRFLRIANQRLKGNK
ncbi:MAG: hypothetical protein IKW89_08465 [Bacteroidales bacterium]|nr:hypothetical protein [Bacteroidales bacterium]